MDVDHARPVVVLGMHRSGTSVLTGSLEQVGVHLGEVIEHSPDNLKGSRESRRLMALHDDILDRNGGDWKNPPAQVRWEAVHVAMRDCYIDLQAAHAPWGFKDPRTLLVLAGWLQALPYARLVGIFRHPLQVAMSLERRNGFELDAALGLWLTYNRILIWHHENNGPFPIIEFAENDASFDAQLRSLMRTLSLPDDRATFFEPGLRHTSLPTVAAAERLREALVLYERLQGLTTAG